MLMKKNDEGTFFPPTTLSFNELQRDAVIKPLEKLEKS